MKKLFDWIPAFAGMTTGSYKFYILLCIVIVGSILRFTSVNWDSFQAFHPDERNISWAVTRIHFFDQLNPKFFAYGGLPIYLYRALGEGVVHVTKDQSWLLDWGKIAVIGRYVSATLSSLSIILIYLVGFAYFSPAVGVLSSFFLAFSPWAIREAHFATTETMLVFFLLLTLYFTKTKKIFLLGVIWGCAVAAKTTSVLFGFIPLVASPKKFPIAALVAAAIFLLFSPYTVLDFAHFKESMQYETGVALGTLPVPYTLQFRSTIPYLYQFQTMLWQAGPLIFVGVVGLFLMLFRKKYWLFLVFPLLYFGWSGSWYAKFDRYNEPFLPFATIAAAWLISRIIKKTRLIGEILLFLTILITMFWGLANWTIYLRPQTRIAGSRWMYEHIPQTAMVYTEHWNDGMPVTVPGVANINFKRDLLAVYEPDNTEKLNYYGEKLSIGDFIILSTRRIWATMPRLKDKYPITSKFYEKLLNGELGYKEVARFTSYPSLFGIEINDDTSEESVQVFDHPTVLIFQNTEKLSREEIQKRLSET